jgi:hypothetical protein
MSFERARKIADAVLYEGYVLYPYRASAQKNQFRWQFGIVAPRAWSEAGGDEDWASQTECLVEAGAETRITGKIRFLQTRSRSVEQFIHGEFRRVQSFELDDQLLTSWDEGIEREVDFELSLSAAAERSIAFNFPSERYVEQLHSCSGELAGRVVREVQSVEGQVCIRVQSIPSPYSITKLGVRIENLTPYADLNASRDEAMRRSLVGVHTMLAVVAGSFVSMTDPPEWARVAAAECKNIRSWPVLIGDEGERTVMLSSPIILQDYPEIAPESPADLCDATEIDEILTLRTMTLTDDEKREARATDPRAHSIIDGIDAMPQEMLDRLHGALRYVRASAPKPETAVPWWDPGADASVSPETDSLEIAGISISKGSRVRLRPRTQSADAQDMFLAGRVATVEGVFLDVEDRNYLAVTLEDDPAAELHQWHGRFLYFGPDEVEPIEGSA